MHTFTAERIVDVPPIGVESTIAALVDRLWGERARTVVASTAAGRVTAIEAETGHADVDVWLTCRVEATGASTRVTLILDELDAGPDPRDGLEQLLDLIERAITPTRA